MELWIRSQDREILKRINTEIYQKYDLSDYAKGYVYFLVSGGTKLGEYETKERALEILDEIQNLLQPKVFIEQPEIDFKADDMIEKLSQNIILNTTTKMNAELKNVGQIVYEMPEE